MSHSLYSTYHLDRVVQRLRQQPRFFLNRFFKEEVTHETEEIFFDTVENSEGITPFVHPLHEGRILTHKGYKTNSYKPAYVKEKVIHDPELPLKRMAGEAFGGSMSAEQRLRLHVINDVNRLRERLNNRLEVMAAEVCKTGKALIKGEGFNHLVDFGRDASLTIDLSKQDTKAEDKWSNPDMKMTEFLEAKSQLVRDKSNRAARATDLIMGPTAWNWFRANNEVKKSAELLRNVDSTIVLTPSEQTEDIQYKGRFGDFDVFVHYGRYLDDGVEKRFLEPNEIMLMGKSIEGVRHFGAIKDLKAQISARQFFLKSWETEDPSHRYIMIQSAPLLVPYDANASCLIKAS